jgi:hypothetical protein
MIARTTSSGGLKMKAKNRTIRVVILLGALLISAFLATNLFFGNSSQESDISASGTIFLARPAFAEGIDTTFLEEEAGISAYTNVGRAIDLEAARSAFRTIEYETDEYIVGSVPLPDYAETEDVHAFVHRDGWIVSYYLRDEPAAKIVDWEDYGGGEMTGTKLEIGIGEVSTVVQIPVGEIRYYHFRYPNANRLMIVADALWGSSDKSYVEDTFRIKLPGDFTFYERSYSFHGHDVGSWNSTYHKMYIDEEEIVSMRLNDEARTTYDLVSSLQLWPDEFHTVKTTIEGEARSDNVTFGAIALLYQEP